jgi:tRNA (cmo5U34)-methyltransferase
MNPWDNKATIAEIRERFDSDVERFSNLETGQTATVDAPLAMELITQAAVVSTQPIDRVLDLGCGAGNNTLKLHQVLGHDFDGVLLDLSPAMVQRACQRVQVVNGGTMTPIVGDFREVALESQSFDVILAAAVLHHLRDDRDWEQTFAKIYDLLRPGGSVWITDLVIHESPGVQQLMWRRYGDYLTALQGESYRDRVFEYIDREDSPRPITYQLNLLQRVGFGTVELLHKNSCFYAFGAIKTPPQPHG